MCKKVYSAGSLATGKSDPVVDTLASSKSRVILKEGDLKKVCKKANRIFRFWLFNDMLIYGSRSGETNYIFNRAIDLESCSIMLHEDENLPLVCNS